jgi:hypothetical protein
MGASDASDKGHAAAGPYAIGIWPAARWLPANILRFYLQFSEPSEAAFERTQLRLAASTGALIQDAFLLLNEELWSPDGRRLTVYMEPGRIKRGMGTNPAHEPALVPGEFYHLEVTTGGRVFRRAFGTLPPVVEPLLESQWRLTRPRAGTRQPVEVVFDRVIDHAIVADEVHVQGPDGRRLAGIQALSDNGLKLAFHPDAHWKNTDYSVVFSRRFEDVCGNRLGEALDHLLAAQQRSRGGALSFRPLAQ